MNKEHGLQKQLISQLSATIENKSVFVSERGLTSTQWPVYSGGTKRVQYSTVPGSAITAETVTVDGVTLSQKDTAGVVTTATRRLAIQKDSSWFSAPARLAKQGVRSQVCSRLGGWLLKPHPAYGWDLTKNICALYGPSGYTRTAYTYSPYGQVSSTGDVEQAIQWSSEFNDTELGLIYYNYRHYNPLVGRWLGRDILTEKFSRSIYNYINNQPQKDIDVLGLLFDQIQDWANGKIVIENTTINEDSGQCHKCISNFNLVKKTIESAFTVPMGINCTISYKCVQKAQWKNEKWGAYTDDFKQNKDNLNNLSATIYVPCHKCEKTSYIKGGEDYTYSFEFLDNIMHEAQHAVDWCRKEYDSTASETRAYFKFNIRPKEKITKSFIDALRKLVKNSTEDRFSETQFQQKLKELGVAIDEIK